MFKEKYRLYIRWGITAALSLIAAITFCLIVLQWGSVTDAFHKVQGILTPVYVGAVIAFILDSIVEAMLKFFSLIRKKRPQTAKSKKISRAIAIVASELFFVAVVSLLIRIVVPQLVDSMRTIINNFDTYVQNLENLTRPYLDRYPQVEAFVLEQIDRIRTSVSTFLRNDMNMILTSVTSGVLTVGTSVYNFAFGAIVSIYLLFNKEHIMGIAKKLLFAIFRLDIARSIRSETQRGVYMMKRFLVGKLLDSSIIGILCFIGTMIMGAPYALLISFLVGISNIIPYFGPIFGAVPSSILILMLDPQKFLIFVIFIIILQQLDGNVIGPKIVGNTTGVSSVGVLLSILVGGGLFGLPGMILAVPIYGVLYSIIKRLTERRLKAKNLPPQTELYADASANPQPTPPQVTETKSETTRNTVKQESPENKTKKKERRE